MKITFKNKSFSIKKSNTKNYFIGLVGENGAGKTTESLNLYNFMASEKTEDNFSKLFEFDKLIESISLFTEENSGHFTLKKNKKSSNALKAVISKLENYDVIPKKFRIVLAPIEQYINNWLYRNSKSDNSIILASIIKDKFEDIDGFINFVISGEINGSNMPLVWTLLKLIDAHKNKYAVMWLERMIEAINEEIGEFEKFEMMYGFIHEEMNNNFVDNKELGQITSYFDSIKETFSLNELLNKFEYQELFDGEVISVTMEDASSGQIRLFKMVFNIISNTITQNNLIIIDEVDLFLHPRWLSQIIGLLDSLVKESIFVITTHNPIIISGLRQESVILLPNLKNPKTETFGSSIEGILNSVFQMDGAISENAKTFLRAKAKAGIEEYIKMEEENAKGGK